MAITTTMIHGTPLAAVAQALWVFQRAARSGVAAEIILPEAERASGYPMDALAAALRVGAQRGLFAIERPCGAPALYRLSEDAYERNPAFVRALCGSIVTPAAGSGSCAANGRFVNTHKGTATAVGSAFGPRLTNGWVRRCCRRPV